MSRFDERFRDLFCLNIYDGIDSMQMLGDFTRNRAKSLERRIR